MLDNKKTDISSRRIELVFRKLKSLSVMPAVAIEALSKVLCENLDSQQLTSMIESDPALSVCMYSLAYENDISFSLGGGSVAELVHKLPLKAVREKLFSVKVYQTDAQGESQKAISRKDIAINSLAMACCSELIAESLNELVDKKLAYSAGLLVNIGKYAIDESLPKSYAKIAREAKSKNTPFGELERKYLGIDHNVIGKRLAHRWHLPAEIVESIWLYNSSLVLGAESLGLSPITKIVQLAYVIVSKSSYALCGDVDQPATRERLGKSLSLSESCVESIRHRLVSVLEQRKADVFLDSQMVSAEYFESFRAATNRLSRSNSRLEEENRKLCVKSRYSDFTSALIANIQSDHASVEVAGKFAELFAQEFQCKNLGLCMLDKAKSGFADVVTIDSASDINEAIIEFPASGADIESWIGTNVVLPNIPASFEWLFDALLLGNEKDKFKAVVISSKSKPLAILLFEISEKTPLDFRDGLSEIFNIAGDVFLLCAQNERQLDLSEGFAQIIAGLDNKKAASNSADVYLGISEMAAGAAHELNNPLSVISGRAQFLLEMEQDEKKRKMLQQIQHRSDEMAGMVSSLMNFAKPKNPVPRPVSIRSIIDGAVNDCVQKKSLTELNVRLGNCDVLPNVQVDAQQMVTAISSIVANAIESYQDIVGEIEIRFSFNEQANSVAIMICDEGCGMDQQTIINSTKPFYSSKIAGRQRGMGLAIAKRLIELNNGSMQIDSNIGQGCKVIVSMPVA